MMIKWLKKQKWNSLHCSRFLKGLALGIGLFAARGFAVAQESLNSMQMPEQNRTRFNENHSTVPFEYSGPLSSSTGSSTTGLPSVGSSRESVILGMCSWCAQPRGALGATTIDIAAGFPTWFSARSTTAIYSHSPSFRGFALSLGAGVRVDSRQAFLDLIVLTHFFTNRHFSIGAQIVGNVGAAWDHRPLLNVDQTNFAFGMTAGLIATVKFEPHVYLSLHTAFEFKGLTPLPYYAEPLVEDTVTILRSPSTLGLLIEPTVEVKIHRYVNLFLRGGYTFRWDFQNSVYARPRTLLSDWHIGLGLTLKIPASKPAHRKE